ncbi:MAG: Fe-S oxidoreductase, partial [Haloarculaceae archaeon]
DPLDSGCCGMAGSFGYEAEHYDISQAIGRILFRQVEQSPGEQVVAPGASCRSQLGDREGESKPPHPIEKVAEAVTGSAANDEAPAADATSPSAVADGSGQQ